jgi:transposase
MLGRNASQPTLFQMVDLASLVPPEHRLRKIDAVLDLAWVSQAVSACYSERGRPSIDPELFLRMLLLGRLYDLSDRELCAEIAMHAGMRWFCRLQLHDAVPDHSTLSKLKDKWAGAGVFQDVFDRVVRQCAEAGLVSGRHVSIDGSEVRANASMKSLAPLEAAPGIAPDPTSDTPEGGTQEPQPEGGWRGHGVKYSNQTHRSTSDPEARLYRKSKGREARLSYLMHDLIDTKSRVILRRRVSAAHSSAEREIARVMLAEVLQKREVLALPAAPEIASLDAGYGTGSFAADVLEMGVLPHMPLQASPAPESIPTWKRPTRNMVQYRRRREKVRIVQARNRVRDLQQTRGYRVSRKLRIRSEHVFAEAKTIHGMDRARQRGRAKVQLQAELVGIVQNLKRLAAFRGRRGGKAAHAAQPLPCGSPIRGRITPPAYARRDRAMARTRLRSTWRQRTPIRRPPSSTAF